MMKDGRRHSERKQRHDMSYQLNAVGHRLVNKRKNKEIVGRRNYDAYNRTEDEHNTCNAKAENKGRNV